MKFAPKSAEPKVDGRRNNRGHPGSGRRAGGKNKATIAREEAARLIEHKMKTGEDIPLAKEALEELMNEALIEARRYAPSTGKRSKAARKLFREWSSLAGMWATRLIGFQSPALKAIMVNPTANQRTPGAVVTELLDAIDSESRSAPLQIGGPMPERVT